LALKRRTGFGITKQSISFYLYYNFTIEDIEDTTNLASDFLEVVDQTTEEKSRGSFKFSAEVTPVEAPDVKRYIISDIVISLSMLVWDKLLHQDL
jgi:hypothetical protein